MGEVIQLQGDQRKDVQEFLVAKDGLELDSKTIKVWKSHLRITLNKVSDNCRRSMVSKRTRQSPVLSCPAAGDRKEV